MHIETIDTIRFEHEMPYSWDEEGHKHPGEPRPREQTITHVVVDGGPDGYCNGGSPAFNENASALLAGEDPLRRAALWERLVMNQSRSGGNNGALAAVDCALHDVAGKVAEQPVWKLLGGYRDAVPCYASTMVGDDDPSGLGTAEAYADYVEQLVADGFPAVKLHSWMPPYDPSPSRQIEMFAAVRDRVGPDVELMVDSHHYYARTEAKRIGDALAALDYAWFEEPMNEYSMASYEWLTHEVDIPIIGPESAAGRVQTRAEWISRGIADISRVGVRDVGGLTPAMQIVGLCAGFGVECEVHGNGMGNIHLLGAMSIPGRYLEWGLLHPHLDHDTVWYAPHLENDMSPVDGIVTMPEGPGLGYEFDWSFIDDNRLD